MAASALAAACCSPSLRRRLASSQPIRAHASTTVAPPVKLQLFTGLHGQGLGLIDLLRHAGGQLFGGDLKGAR